MAVIYVTTLDSHEYFGPFSTEGVAHRVMKHKGYTSYQLSTSLPEYVMKQLRKEVEYGAILTR